MIRIFTYGRFLALLLISSLIFAGCNSRSNISNIKKPRLTPKYNSKDKEPMGSYIAYHYLNSLFENGVTDIINKPLAKLDYSISYNKSLYIIVGKGIFMSDADVATALNYVSNGNTMFISGDFIDQELLDTLGLRSTFDFGSFLFHDEYEMDKKDTWVSISQDPKKYGFYFTPLENHIYDYDSSATQVLGYNESGKPNFVAINYGQGKFIFHTAPATFSNYFLLTGNNKEYLEKAFSYFDFTTQSVYWDNYYRARKGSSENFSIIGFFKKHEQLYFALLLVLAGLLLFIAFGGKRRQRITPEKNPNINTTVSYTETIGRLYLQKKDNRNIALKMFTYFLEYVRTHYYLNTQTLNDEFAEALARKSGIAETKVKLLLRLMDDTDRAENISDIQLLEIHNNLQEYFKK